MSTVPGIPGLVFTALGNQQINILAIAQGSSECSISLIVSAEQSDSSVRAIHNLIVT
jgi:aspartate kinase